MPFIQKSIDLTCLFFVTIDIYYFVSVKIRSVLRMTDSSSCFSWLWMIYMSIGFSICSLSNVVQSKVQQKSISLKTFKLPNLNVT